MKLLNIAQVADYLSVSTISVRRMIKAGTLPHVRLNRCVRVPQDAVDKLVRVSQHTGQ